MSHEKRLLMISFVSRVWAEVDLQCNLELHMHVGMRVDEMTVLRRVLISLMIANKRADLWMLVECRMSSKVKGEIFLHIISIFVAVQKVVRGSRFFLLIYSSSSSCFTGKCNLLGVDCKNAVPAVPEWDKEDAFCDRVCRCCLTNAPFSLLTSEKHFSTIHSTVKKVALVHKHS